MDPSFSWGDTFRAAVHSCLAPCFPASPDSDSEVERYENPHRALTQNADLDRLLITSTSDSETDALSLHSNFGSHARRKRQRRRKGKRKPMTLFGYNLFGKPTPPIQLPDDSDDEGLLRHSQISTTRSASTLDSDAPQLSATSLDALSPEVLEARAAQAAKDEQERQEREQEREKEKQKRRKDRKEMKRVAAALATTDGEFEGFPGSGSGFSDDISRNIPSPFRTTGSAFSGSDVGSNPYSPRLPHPPDHAQGRDDVDDADADLDGAMYSSRTRGTGVDGSSGSGSRSRTSASISQHSYSNSPRSNDISSSEKPKKKKKKGTKSASSRSTVTTASSDPVQPASPPISPHPTSPIVQDFDGTPGGINNLHQLNVSALKVEPSDIVRGMPSPGLSGPRGKRGLSVTSAGAFLNNGGGGF